MANKKVIFVAFAIEDERQRDFLKGQSLNTQSPFEYIDMSVKDAYTSEWKERVRTRIAWQDHVELGAQVAAGHDSAIELEPVLASDRDQGQLAHFTGQRVARGDVRRDRQDRPGVPGRLGHRAAR